MDPEYLKSLEEIGVYTEDLKLGRLIRQGDAGEKVILIQEWLCLHGIHVVIDGDFGPATTRAVKAFQKSEGVSQDGILGNITFSALVRPMTDALESVQKPVENLGDTVIACAEKHLEQHPREIGGANCGPWVRLYLDGMQKAPWCAGFVSLLLKQACHIMRVSLSLKTSFSCDQLAGSAKENGLFLKEGTFENVSKIRPGSIFLNRKTESDWTHTGIAIKMEQDLFYTIEGNTNDEGDREGYEVCGRIRGYSNKDFILL